MSLTKTPFFGLGSKGTVGGVLTSQKRGSATLLRQTPRPTDPYTLPQAYQRWLYEDYAYRWTQQSAATSAAYRLAGSRFHLTGFQYWMKDMLTRLPDIVAMYHLDEGAGAIAHDSSRNLYNGTIFGASPAVGVINGCQYFDGLNDRITLGNQISPAYVTLECYARTRELPFTAWRAIQGSFDGTPRPFELLGFNALSTLRWHINTISGETPLASLNLPAANQWFHVAALYDGAIIAIYIDGLLSTSAPLVDGPINAYPQDCWIGWRPQMDISPWWGDIDHLIIWNRALNLTEILRHSLRRYPP